MVVVRWASMNQLVLFLAPAGCCSGSGAEESKEEFVARRVRELQVISVCKAAENRAAALATFTGYIVADIAIATAIGFAVHLKLP